MRADVASALNALDAKGQASITGLRVPRQVKKGFEGLESFLEDEVLALATGNDPGPSMSEQRDLGAAGSLGAIANIAKSARLLVLTASDLWEVQATGRLNGNRPHGIRLPLRDIHDVRVRTDRRIGALGAKERFLAIDYMRGMQLETRVHQIATDSALEILSERLLLQMGTLAERAASVEGATASSAVAQLSVADELAKLAHLRDSGILTEDEFAQQKAKLL
jgi:hypothetical protein